MTNPIVRGRFFRERLSVVFKKPSRTQQHLKDETDINLIMAKYKKTGLISHVAKFNGLYGNFLDTPDMLTAMNEVAKANEMFASLPSKLRERFSNDPLQFLDFVHNEENVDEMKKLGLIVERAPAPATLDDVVTAVKAGKSPPPDLELSSK